MNNENRQIRAQQLFDEIGLIDDRFIAEAETPYRSPASGRLIKRLFLVAASLAVCASILFGTLVAGMMIMGDTAEDKDDASPPKGGANQEMADDDEGNAALPLDTLSAKLSDMRSATASLKVSPDSVDLFSGNAQIIWKYTDESEYRVYQLSAAEADTLSAKLKADKGKKVDGDGDGALDGIWITLGDGLVMTPCLERTAGNVGYGQLFEYEPEYEPSAELSDLICDVIS